MTTFLFAQVDEKPLFVVSVQGGIDHIKDISTDPLLRARATCMPIPALHLTFDIQKTLPIALLAEAGWHFNDYLTINGGYLLRNYEIYHTAEHNMVYTAAFRMQRSRLGGGAQLGYNVRFMDFDGDVPDPSRFFIWQGTFLYAPTYFLDLRLSLGNNHNDLPVSMGYLELALNSSWRISEHFSLTADVGTAWSGTGSLAGYANRFFAQGGVSYAFPLR